MAYIVKASLLPLQEGGFELAERIDATWRSTAQRGRACVVFSGREPLRQLDEPLIGAMKACGVDVAINANGTQTVPSGADSVRVIPKPPLHWW